jgi:hypothetical protein
MTAGNRRLRKRTMGHSTNALMRIPVVMLTVRSTMDRPGVERLRLLRPGPGQKINWTVPE